MVGVVLFYLISLILISMNEKVRQLIILDVYSLMLKVI